jgi:hypothetical protein
MLVYVVPFSCLYHETLEALVEFSHTLVYMKNAPKVMPPIYFHVNYNRRKVHNNAVGWSTFSATKNFCSTQSPLLASIFASDEQNLHAALIKICTSGGDLLFHFFHSRRHQENVARIICLSSARTNGSQEAQTDQPDFTTWSSDW